MLFRYLRTAVVVGLAGVLFPPGIAAQGAGAPADLIDLYARATELDPAFQAASLERLVAGEAIRESRALRLPVVDVSLEAAQTYQDIVESDSFLFTPGSSDFVSDSYRLSVTQPLYRQQAFTQLPQARAQERQAQALLIAAEQDLILRVAEATFGYLAARDSLEQATAVRVAIWRQLQETEQRLGSGLATLTELHEARARHALAEADELTAGDELSDRLQALAEIVGEPPAAVLALSDALPLVQPEQSDPQSWVRAGLFQNPRIKAREAAVDIARQEVRRQRSGRFPTVDLVGSFGSRDSGGTNFGGEGGTEVESSELAVRVGIPVYDGGRTSANTRVAQLRQRIALQQLEQEKRRVEREVRAAFQGVTGGISRVQALQTSVFSHEAALARKEEGMRSGVNTGLEVLDARRELFRARLDLTRARYEYILNGLRLERAAGALGVENLRQINAYLQ